ncbi:Na+/H+ antiporter NhaA [Salinicola corii]|uniref:Na+/H+ antiporter NhaA n=1 Tax=Salinicola corii TaxID=2606937 RepID=A0A640WAQ4_9GAMM|nr:Na+/H+ antiporter NhaA [Salinicola corii]
MTLPLISDGANQPKRLSFLGPYCLRIFSNLCSSCRILISDNRLQAILAKVTIFPRDEPSRDNKEGRRDLQRANVASREIFSPLERFELALYPWVAFTVLPAFALANAGLPLFRYHHGLATYGGNHWRTCSRKADRSRCL